MSSSGSKVEYRFLGKSGLKVSDICLGTMTFGPRMGIPGQCSEEQSHELLDKFVEWGGNFIDTANVYGKGKSEEIIGSWLAKQKRDRLVIATKLRAQMDDGPNGVGLSRANIMHEVNESLQRLQTDYIDLYQIHGWDDGTPIEETLSALNDLVRMGKVRYLGASNLLGWHMQKIVDICQQKGYDSWVSLQQQYNLLVRQSEMGVFDVCKHEGIGVLPWSPLKGGWLSGKLRRDTKASSLDMGTRVGFVSQNKDKVNQANPDYGQFANETTWKLLDLMETIGKVHGKSIPQVALRWLLEKKVVTSVVIGAKTIQQLEDNMGASGWSLSQEEVTQLDDASPYDIPYPYEMVFRMNKARQRDN